MGATSSSEVRQGGHLGSAGVSQAVTEAGGPVVSKIRWQALTLRYVIN